MKTARGFFKPLAIGAPAPYRELPARVERMIHFVPPHLEKVRAKVPEIAPTVDVILANLEDAIPADAKGAALAGLIEMSRATDFKALGVGFWTRINCLNSPWHLDEVSTIVEKAGDKIDVVSVKFRSKAEKTGFQQGQQITALEVEADRPSPNWMLLPTLGVLGFIVFLQRRRLPPAEPKPA